MITNTSGSSTHICSCLLGVATYETNAACGGIYDTALGLWWMDKCCSMVQADAATTFPIELNDSFTHSSYVLEASC